MTYREKLRLEHPELRSTSVMNVGCPHDYRYEDAGGCAVYDGRARSCAECWDREIPGTETDISNNKKENETMPTHKVSVNKMTKRELIEEIEIAHNHIVEMEAKLEDLQKYEKYKDCANEIKAIHAALMDSGFTNEQAFDLLKTTMQSMMPTILRGMSL